MNCREFLIEFEDRGALSEPAVLHLTICTDCKKLSERQTQIWQMIDRFAQVNAPKDFDFRVKARIANAQTTDFQPRFLPVLRYVLPVAVVVALVGLIAFNTSYFSNRNVNNLSVAEKNNPATVQNNAPSINNPIDQTAFTPTEIAQKPTEETAPETIQPPLNNRPPRNETAELSPKQRQKNNNSNNDEFAGTHDSGVSSGNTRTPKGIGSNSKSGIILPKSPDEAMILSFDSGIETVSENGKRTVKSIKLNSVGARSGIKIGDVIEKVEGDSITILRGAERIEIKLQRTITQP